VSGKVAKAGGLALVFYIALFEFLAGTRWTGFTRLILFGLVILILLLQRKRMGWFGWGAAAFTCIWLVLSFGPGGSGIISQVVAPDGTEMCLVQGYSGNLLEPYRISFYCRHPGQNWDWYYYDHKDTRWWYGSIKLKENGTRATIYRLLRPVAYFDLPTESLTIVRWGQGIAGSHQQMEPGWHPTEHCSWLPDILYLKPKVFNLTYSFEFSPDPNKIDPTKDLKVWLPLPREWDSQKAVQILSIDPPPDGTYEEPEFGNRMAFWDFGKGPEKDVYIATLKYRLVAYKIHVEVDPAKIGTYDKSNPEYILYTCSEHTICITPKIQELAKEAVGNETNPYRQARLIAQYVYNKKVHYKILDFERGRGIQCLLDYPVKDVKTGEEYYEGCCSQQSALSVALCRAVGIPARAVTGIITAVPMLYGKQPKPLFEFETRLSPAGFAGSQWIGYVLPHTWSEFYLPNIGWIPVDGRVGLLDRRIILSKGRDIKIGPECPDEESLGYGSQWIPLWNGRADHMHHAVWNIAKIRSPKVTVIVSRE
jgi:transglutaminase-like putative cysteine protease